MGQGAGRGCGECQGEGVTDSQENVGDQQNNVANAAEIAGTEQKSVRELDAEYMAAVKAGDMEKAQKMVDDAAKEVGYTQRMYYGMIIVDMILR